MVAATEGEDDGASPFATMTPTPTPTPVATPIPPTTQVGTSTATTLTSDDGTVTLELPAGSRSEPYQVNFETATGCSYAGAKADVSFTCVSALIFDSEDILETDVEFDAAPTIAFHLTAEQVKALGGEFLLTKLHEMGGLMILTRASAGEAVDGPRGHDADVRRRVGRRGPGGMARQRHELHRGGGRGDLRHDPGHVRSPAAAGHADTAHGRPVRTGHGAARATSRLRSAAGRGLAS